MSKLKFALIFALCLAVGVFTNSLVVAQLKTAASHNCSSCHTDAAKILPKTHPSVNADDIGACVTCHNVGLTGQAKKNEFSTRIHLAHHAANVDCSTCHTIVIDKSFSVIGDIHSSGAPKVEDVAALQATMTSWAESKFTDHAHANAGVDCAGCHGKELPISDATVENDRCLACHGPVEKLAAKTQNIEFPKRNPHASHLGDDIACTACHKGHQASVVYCADCHKLWKMNIPGAGN